MASATSSASSIRKSATAAQVEVTDKWLQKGNAWEIPRPDDCFYVSFGGHTESYTDEAGRFRARWVPGKRVKGMAYDTPVLGYRVNTCNTLRLWRSEAVESFDFQDFNLGDYYGAVQEKVVSETISKVLYPNDEPEAGRRLRLAQQYFFVSCSLQDMLRLLDLKGDPITRLPDLFAAQMNDTHPSIAVAELMRLLVDERLLPWDEAWDLTRRTLAYTNHTLLPEALETWGLPLFGSLLPRPLEIIYEINRRFLDEVRARHPGDDARIARLSLIDEAGEKRVRMANLATVGSHAVNGVAALHSELLRQTVLRDFAELWPERFDNVTNGVTPRRFLVLSNPPLAQLLDEAAGEGWVTELSRLRALEPLADDAAFQDRWHAVKRANKEALARRIRERAGVVVDPAALFDIQVKRIHEYKRQHLNVLHVVTLYNRLRANPRLEVAPRCVVFGGKAAPGYFMAKLIIRLINGVAEVVNSDPAVNGRLKVVFFPDFNVKNAHAIYPAADLSEQISTAGKEASGTGNMKFMLNGAVTIGTLDGANVEIREEAGAENFFLFGLTAEKVEQVWREGYRPESRIENNAELRAGARLHRRRNLLPRRSRAVPAARRQPSVLRPVSRARRLRRLHGRPGSRGCCVARSAAMDAHVDPEHGAFRQVLLRPVDPRVLRAHMERTAGQDRARLSGGHDAIRNPPRITLPAGRQPAGRRGQLLRLRPSRHAASSCCCSRRRTRPSRFR